MRTTARTAVAFSLAVVVLAIAAVAAAQAPSPPAAGDVPTSAPADPGTGDPIATCPVGTTDCQDTPMPGDPQVVEPTPGMANVRARPFDSATPSDDGRTVTIDFVSGVEPCYVLDHMDVAYGTDTVTITLFEGNDPNAGDVACIEIGVFKRTIVTLDEPLGDRAIVDGAA